MNPTIYRYPLDGTGTSPDNLVKDEEHQLSNRTIRCVAPTYGGFFATGVIVVDAITNIELEHGRDKDYIFGELFEFPTGRYQQEIFGLIVIKKPGVSKVKITYQALGGDYSYSMDAIIAMIDNLNIGERPVAWPDIIGKPPLFDPASHFHDLGDVYGFEYVVQSLERIRSAILLGDTASHDEIYRYVDQAILEQEAKLAAVRAELAAHIADKGNPHQVTKAQVGLDLVQNFGTATQEEMATGANNLYTTANVVNNWVRAYTTPYQTHLGDTTNPHQVTKTQIGLSNVQNFPIATDLNMENGNGGAYLTPDVSKRWVDHYVAGPLYDHISDTTNPHQVTKTQIGLSLVDNYSTATDQNAQEGISNSSWMTPRLVRTEIQRLAITPLDTHANRNDNPHQTTKAQVGLGNVPNNFMASVEQGDAGSESNAFMSPYLVSRYVTANAVTPLNAHVARTDNPHGTTKAQVGLSLVENYGIATQENMIYGVPGSYLTPDVVKFYVDTITTPLNAHVARSDNPHGTTKAQVGLDLVQNFPIATDLNMENGNGGAYLTPDVAKRWVDTFVAGPLYNHISERSNPHQVTKAQVGLGSVENFTVASQEEMAAGANNLYTTANVVNNWVRAYTTPYQTHIGRADNPHQVTKAQVGLSNVQNYGIAIEGANIEQASATLYATPKAVREFVIGWAVEPLSYHKADTANPHQVTKAQVGLGSVENFTPVFNGTDVEGAGANTYVTPKAVHEFVSKWAIAPLSDHKADTANPHQTTKAQVGLGNVQNYGIATHDNMWAGNGDLYLTPDVVKFYVDSYAITPLNNHVNRSDNPHGTTKAQVGLGNVLNYGVANQDQVNAGQGGFYVTPDTIKAYVDVFAIAPAQQHANRTDNPHGTTKAQVGLGNVQNYPMASIGEMDAGVTSTAYVSPALVNRFVNINAIAPLNAHTGRTDNPHNVTKAQVGLSNVQNFPMASDGEAQAGNIAEAYMNPRLVRIWTDANFANYLASWKATVTETVAGERDDRWVTPYGLQQMVANRLTSYYTRPEVDWLINDVYNRSNNTVFTYGSDVSVYQWSSAQGVINSTVNYFDVFPPQGKAMGNLQAFIPSISQIQFNGAVDDNDTMRCIWVIQADRIRVWTGNTEQRSAGRANWLAIWR